MVYFVSTKRLIEPEAYLLVVELLVANRVPAGVAECANSGAATGATCEAHCTR